MKSKLWVLVAALVVGGMSSAANALSVFLQPQDQSANLGDAVSVDLWWDFTNDATLGGGTNIAWDPAILSLASVVFSSNPAFDPFFTRPGDVSPGLINGLATGSFNGLAGTGPLYIATITFNTLAEGSTVIDLGPNVSPAGPFVSAITFAPQNVDFIDGSVSVSAIPLPAAAWLMIGGLGALLGFRRKA